MTKIFCDIADIREIKKFNRKNIVKGFTTNPSLMRKAGAKDYSFYSKKILKLTNKPVSCEVFADDEKNMIRQGLKISKWGRNVYVKVPVTNSKGKFMGKVIHELNKEKIKLLGGLFDIIGTIFKRKNSKEMIQNAEAKRDVKFQNKVEKTIEEKNKDEMRNLLSE